MKWKSSTCAFLDPNGDKRTLERGGKILAAMRFLLMRLFIMRFLFKKTFEVQLHFAMVFCAVLILCAMQNKAYAQEVTLWNPTTVESSSQGSGEAQKSIHHPADLFFPGDEAYDTAVLEAIRAGHVPESNVFPLFGSEFDVVSAPKKAPGGNSEINSSSNSESSLGSTCAAPVWRSGFSLSLSTPTLYYDSPATQDDLASNLLGEPSLTVNAFPEIQHFWNTLPDVLALDIRLYPSRSIAFKIDASLFYRRDKIIDQNSTFQWNLDEWLGNLLGVAEFPRKSYVAWVGKGYGVALGRFPSGMGWGKLSGSILNPRASWYDQIRFHLDSGPFRFTSMIATSSAQLSKAEEEIQFRKKEDGSSFWDSQNDHDYAGHDQAIKLANWHQIEWKPAPWLEIALAEMSIMGGRLPSLSFVLPSAIWHNVYAAGYSNVGVSLSAAAVPLPGLLISGELFVDDVLSYDEAGTTKPQALAWLGTARWSNALTDKLFLDSGLEYQHVDQWTYTRWNPYLAMYQRQALTGGRRSLDQSLGAPWGPDYDSIGAYANLRFRSGASLQLSYEFIRKGPIYQGMASQVNVTADFDGNGKIDLMPQTIWVPVYYDYDKYAGDGALEAILSRPDEYRHLVTLTGALPLGEAVDFKLSATFGFYQNFGHISGATDTAFLLYAGIVVRLASR